MGRAQPPTFNSQESALGGRFLSRFIERNPYLAETVRGSGEALMTIINDILDFSEIVCHERPMESTTWPSY
jgi:hypothetical protein